MREKAFFGKKIKEKYKFLAVVAFFLISGICYSHSFYGGSLDMGKAVSINELAKPAKAPVSAEGLMNKIDINTAAVEELIHLSGIGENRAADIITYREQNGGFRQIEDIMNVSGIGEKTFEEIKGQITVGE